MKGKDRITSIVILTVIFYIFGILEIVAGLSLLSLANIASSIFFYTGVLAWVTMSLGIAVVITGVLYFLAGRWIWRAKRSGAIVGLITAISGIILNIIFVPVAPISSVLGIMLSIVVIALIAVVWKHLR